MPNSISLSLSAQDFHLKKEKSGEHYTLSFKDAADSQVEVAVTLSSAAFETLIRQATVLLPALHQELTPPEIDVGWRASAWPLKQLSDRGWRLLLREVTSESLCRVLWYLKDVEIAKAAMRNMSLRAEEMIIDDLIAKFQGRDPENLPKEEKLVRQARVALQEMLTLLNRFVAEGRIEEDYS